MRETSLLPDVPATLHHDRAKQTVQACCTGGAFDVAGRLRRRPILSVGRTEIDPAQGG